ncbi:hypothetical protein EI555_004725, partial [Monodon monoceros]
GCSLWQKHLRETRYKENNVKYARKHSSREECVSVSKRRPSWLCSVLGLKSHIFSLPEEKHPFMCEYAGWCKRFAIKHSLTRHADMKKMKIKVKASHEKSSWAFHLSACISSKRKHQ